MTATLTAELTRLSVRSVNAIFIRMRQRIAEYCQEPSLFSGECEVDESYFDPRHQRGKRGCGALGKTIVFGIFKHNGHVYTEIVPDCSKQTLQEVIRGRIDINSVIHSDGWRGYNQKPFRVDHGAHQFVDQRAHINGIESFWSFAKRRLLKFNGVSQRTFFLHLKECEFRFNHRTNNLYHVLLKFFGERPL